MTTVPCVPWVTAVTEAWPANVSLLNTAIVTAASSSVPAASSTTSATGATVTVTVAVSGTPPEVTV